MAVVTESATASVAGKRFSWGAVFAGVAMAIVVHIVLGVLGVAIGASTINPMDEGNPVAGIGMGSGIYVVVSALVALFAGGFTAGALATVQDRRDRTLHGLTTWAVATILLFMLLSTAVGRIVGGTAHLVSSGLGKASDAAVAISQPMGEDRAGQQQRSESGERADYLDLSAIRQEARELLRQTGQPELQPENLAEEASRLGDEAASTARAIARDPTIAERELNQLWDRIQGEARETMSAADQAAMVNVLTSRTDMSQQEAERTVQNWQLAYDEAAREAELQWQEFTAQAELKARQWGETAADAAATAAWWTFFVLVLSALAAALGANVGANRPVVQVRESATR